MTTDAKIGLLLGLVFIFIITFIINGLPSLWSHPANAEAAPVTNPQNEKLGLADQAQNAQEKLDWAAVLEREDTDIAPPAVAANVQAQPDSPVREVALATDDSGADVRSSYKLPSLESLADGATHTVEQVIQNLAETPKPTTVSEAPQESKAAIGSVQTQGTAAVNASLAGGAPIATAPVVKKPAAMRVYVVQDGDTLATIAKKAYGDEEGNRLANVQRIFERNRALLKSPDQIAIGQKLVIPPLPASAVDPRKPENVLPATHFEQVPSIGTRSLSTPAGGQGPSDGKWYVVQDGDSLWKIAATQLGNGAKFQDIVKLNGAVLKNQDNLTIGMRLRLPAK
jgi:nucleoid-associated protein YgaU